MILDADLLLFFIGDFSGHGLNAALKSAMIRHFFRAYAREEPDPLSIAFALNRSLIDEFSEGEFVTRIIGMYTASNPLELVIAGHPFPIIMESADSVEARGELPLGIDRSAVYSKVPVELRRGGALVAYTDGLSEARNDSEFFGERRIAGCVKETLRATADAIAENLRQSVLQFSDGALKDDAAILVLKRRL